MIKLAINAVSIDSGGGLTVLIGLLRAWDRLGSALEVTVFASRAEVLASVARARPDVETISFGEGLGLPRRLLLQTLDLGPQIARLSPQVVMGTNMLVERAVSPQIVHHQNLLLFDRTAGPQGLKTRLQAAAARRALRSADRNVFISDFMMQQALSGAPERCRSASLVIHNGLDRELLDGLEQPAFWAGEPDLVAVTSEYPHKDNATLVRALAELVAVAPETPWRLTVAGAGDYRQERALACELGVASRILWRGYLSHEELEAMYRRSLCLVYPSRTEGFGYPPLEAMARRCPAVASRAGAMPEVLGSAALLVDPGQPDRFAAAILRLHRDRDLRRKLVEQGIERVRRFSWEAGARLFEREIQALAARAAK